jgi:death-on-curing protein
MTPIWLQQKFVLAVHEESIAEHGRLMGLRDLGMLESALARPQNPLAYSETEPSLERLAAAYAYGIAANHPFADGNKRTALIASISFLSLNGVRIAPDRADAYRTFLGLAAGAVSEEELAQWFAKNTAAR